MNAAARIAHRRSRHRRRMLGGSRPPGRRRPARCGDVRHDGAPLRPSPDHRGRPRPARRGLRANALLVACGARGRLRPPISPHGRGQPGRRALRHLLYPHWIRRHGAARQHGQAVSPTTLNQMSIKGRTGRRFRCAYSIFGASVSHFPCDIWFTGAPNFSKRPEVESGYSSVAQRPNHAMPHEFPSSQACTTDFAEAGGPCRVRCTTDSIAHAA